MFKDRKIGSRLKVRQPEKPKFRIFRLYQASQPSPFRVEGVEQQNGYEDSGNEVRATMLEAECQKAKALMATQNNRRFYQRIPATSPYFALMCISRACRRILVG